MQLAQAKTFGMLNHHQAGVGHINADFNDRGADQNAHQAFIEQCHHGLFLKGRHAGMQQANPHIWQGNAECFMRFSRVGQVQHFAGFNQRADPVDLPPSRHLRTDALNYFIAPAVVDHFGHDGGAARRQLVNG